MKSLSDKKHLVCAVLLAVCSTLAAAQSTQAGATTAAAEQQSNDAMVAPAAANKQAREIAQGDPARWHREDASAQERWRTRSKEIGAALDEAKNACRQGPAAQRSSCLKAAQATWKEEMSAARLEAGAPRETQTR